METNKYNIPTLEELIIQSKQDGFYKWEYDEGQEVRLLQVINILNYCPDFKEYLELNNLQENYPWTYFIFWMIPSYVNDCYIKDKIDEIETILIFLNDMSKLINSDIIDLLLAWCLEVFDNYKKILPDIVKMMPKNLKELFLKYYSDYLT